MSRDSHSTSTGPRWSWLSRYGSKEARYQWQHLRNGDREFYYRPLGLVECSFDSDGRFFEGRADINAQLTVEVRSSLGDADLRERIFNVWALVRLHHPLLRAKALPFSDFLPNNKEHSQDEIHFIVEKPRSFAVAREEASETIAFLGDHYGKVDAHEFYQHTQNVKRVVDPDRFLARLFVLPFEGGAGDSKTRRVRFLLTAAHEISEGLTMVNWVSHLLTLLNDPPSGDTVDLDGLFSLETVRARFPLAQETLYPQIKGSVARRRWFWALTVVLRHVRSAVQQGFSNPLLRSQPRPSGSSVAFPPKFAAVLDYSRKPPLNTFYTGLVQLSTRATRRIHSLCRAAGASIGAGTFALAAMAAMDLEEERNPNTPLDARKPFVVSFPLNPRAMFSHPDPPDSLMLAFSEGMPLPFLPSYIPIGGRLKLLARSAHRQLRVYQKRAPKTTAEAAELNPIRILATNYIRSFERGQAVLPTELRSSDSEQPQGELPAPNQAGRATHGVSAVGASRGVLQRGAFPLDDMSKDFAADYRDMRQGMKARDNEFLVATGGDAENMWLSVSYDGNAIDQSAVEAWKEKVTGLFDYEDDGKL